MDSFKTNTQTNQYNKDNSNSSNTKELYIFLLNKSTQDSWHYQQKGIINQSDLGSQYLSYDVEKFIENYGMIHSYSRKGTPYDNAPIESFHSIIKRERLSRMVLKTFEEAKMVIFEYIEGFYNRKRIHGINDSIRCI